MTGNRQQLSQVLVNLLSNAADASREDGRVDLLVRADGEEAVIEVMDQGQGIPGELRETIFEPFYTTKPTGRGTGLGLSLAYKIIEEHNGTLVIDSQVGLGTRVIVNRRCRNRNKHMNHLLIIEDEAVIRGALRRLLERHGHQVSEPSRSKSAQEGRLGDYNLIITDLRLPGRPGSSVLGLAPEVPVIIMTHATVTSAVGAMKNGAADYIAKPFDHDEMVMLVDKVLRQQQEGRRAAVLQTDVDQAYPVAGMVGERGDGDVSTASTRSRRPKTVLITGKSGTGKELVTPAQTRHARRRAIHRLQLRRSAEQWSRPNCSARTGPPFRPGLIRCRGRHAVSRRDR